MPDEKVDTVKHAQTQSAKLSHQKKYPSQTSCGNRLSYKITLQSLLDAGNNFSAAFLDAGGDTNAAVAPPEGAEAANEEMADANPTLLRPFQTQRCRTS